MTRRLPCLSAMLLLLGGSSCDGSRSGCSRRLSGSEHSPRTIVARAADAPQGPTPTSIKTGVEEVFKPDHRLPPYSGPRVRRLLDKGNLVLEDGRVIQMGAEPKELKELRGVTRLWQNNGRAGFGDWIQRVPEVINPKEPGDELPKGTGVALMRDCVDYACVVTTEGAVFCKGRNVYETVAPKSTCPVPDFEEVCPWKKKRSFQQVRSLACNHLVVCAVSRSNDLRCWGQVDNLAWQWKDGSHGVRGAYASHYALCVVNLPGRLQCEFRGGYLGDDPTPLDARPVDLVALDGSSICVSAKTGEVYCWGKVGPSDGQTSPAVRRPTRVPGIRNPTALSTTVYGQSCALLEGGKVYCWGHRHGTEFGPDERRTLVPPLPLRIPPQ